MSYFGWRKSDCLDFHIDTQLSLSDTHLKHCEWTYKSVSLWEWENTVSSSGMTQKSTNESGIKLKEYIIQNQQFWTAKQYYNIFQS